MSLITQCETLFDSEGNHFILEEKLLDKKMSHTKGNGLIYEIESCVIQITTNW